MKYFYTGQMRAEISISQLILQQWDSFGRVGGGWGVKQQGQISTHLHGLLSP